jgi:ketosteroid isomerase-like protein
VLSFFGQAQADTASVQQTLMQMERDWGQAAAKNDAAAVGKFVADDWVGIDFEGKSITKAEAMADMKSGASTTQSYEIGPMKVRELGNTAVVTGSDTEKSTYKGKDSSGKYVWTDVWVMRDGRWQAVASQSVKVGK